MIQIQFKAKIKHIRTDKGVEFHMPEFYEANGTLHQKSYVATPQ